MKPRNNSPGSPPDTSAHTQAGNEANAEANNPADTTQDLAGFYRETVLRHSLEPVGFQQDIKATHSNEQYNPLCGDRVTVQFRVDGGHIAAAAFDGEACAICMASASLLCQQAAGHSIKSFKELHQQLEQSLNSADKAGDGGKAVQCAELGELTPLLGVRRYPSRIKCVLLPWTAGSTALRAS